MYVKEVVLFLLVLLFGNDWVTLAQSLETTSKNQSESTYFSPIQSFPTFSSPAPNDKKKSQHHDIDILPPHYYRDVAPMVNGKPVKVAVSVVILNIKFSSDSSQTFDADIFYHNYWSDHRLQKPSNEAAIAQRINLSAQESLPQYKLSDSWRRQLWIPDTYFRNAIGGSVSNIITPTYYFTITNHTEVFMAVRLSLKLSCDMNFSKFPFDWQKCFINISMTSEDINTVVLEWEMFRIGSHVDVTEFEIVQIDKQPCLKYFDIGLFSCLYGEIVFKRNIGNYMIKRFIPSFIIVLMTFIGFWIPTRISPARTALPITALLALITQQIQSDLNVSYVYALQVWNIVCVIFVFANLLEFSIALHIMHQWEKRKNNQEQNLLKKENDSKDMGNKPLTINQISDIQISSLNESFYKQKNESKWLCLWFRLKIYLRNQFITTTLFSWIDKVSRFTFPFAFFCFVIFFSHHYIYS